MRTITLIPLAFALAQVTAHGAPQTDQTDPLMSEIQVRGVMPGYRMQPAEIAEVKGVYVLDNGATLKITNVQRKLFAQLGQRNITELVPVGANRFVSPDQRMSMEYRPVAFADELLVTYPSDLDVASAPMVTVRLALNN